MVEVFKIIEGFLNHRVTNFGNVQTRKIRGTNRIGEWVNMRQSSAHGYKHVTLSENKKRKTFKIHRLVAIAFINNPEGKEQVNHIDGNKTNNHVLNLEWCTAKENMKHANEIGLIRRGGERYSKKIDDMIVLTIRTMPKSCRNKDLSKIYKIKNNTVSQIRAGVSWKHLPSL